MRPTLAPHASTRTSNLLLIVGALAAISLSLWHPRGPDVHEMGAHGDTWFVMHLIGSVGFLTIAVAAMLRLQHATTGLAAGGYAFVAAGGLFTALEFVIDGAVGSALAPFVAESGPTPLWETAYYLERGFSALGLGAYSIGVAQWIASTLTGSGLGMRIAAGFGLLGCLGAFGAGVLFVGFALPVGPLFALMPLTFIWFGVHSVSQLRLHGQSLEATQPVGRLA